jgi:hypothetical protein
MNRFARCLAVTVLALVASATTGTAKPDKVPRLASEAKDLAGFVPKGWELNQACSHDQARLRGEGSCHVVGHRREQMRLK